MIENFKVGDMFIFVDSNGKMKEFGKVLSVSGIKKLVKTHYGVFYQNGREYGRSGDWFTNSIIKWSKDKEDVLLLQRRRDNALHFLKAYDYSNVSVSVLEKMVSMLGGGA